MNYHVLVVIIVPLYESLFGPLITFETTDMFNTVTGAMDTGAVHRLNVGLIVTLEKLAALEGTRGGIANVALNGQG